MTKHLVQILFIGLAWGQDFLINLEGIESSGKYISHNKTTVKFKRDDSKRISSISIDAIKGIRSENGEMIRLEVPKDIATTITFKTGGVKTGYTKSFSLENRNEEGGIDFKEKIFKDYVTIDKSRIRYIKSWNEKTLYPFGVIANKQTGKYHLSNVRHRPVGENSIFFDNNILAETNNFSSCHACFDNRPVISDYRLERALVHQTILAVQNQYEILYEHEDLERLQSIVEKILKDWPETIKGYNYRVQIIRDESLNAFAIGGGNLYLNSGLLKSIETDIELEAVLAHEIAHIERRHTLRQFFLSEKKKNETAFKAILAGVTVAALGGTIEETNAAINIVTALSTFSADLVKSGFSRELEQEADILAQIYLSENNYDKTNMVSLFDKMITYQVTRGRTFSSENSAFSSHPTLLTRIKQIENSEIYPLESPILLTSNSGGRDDISPGFFELQINHLFKFRVGGLEKLYLLGDIKNHHRELAFSIDDIQISLNHIETNIKPSSITTKNGKTIAIDYISHDDTNIKFKYIGKKNISTVPLLNLSDFHISTLLEPKNNNSSEYITMGGMNGFSINYQSESSFMGVIETSKENREKLLQAIKQKSIAISSLKLSPMVLKSSDKNINLDEYGSVNAIMSITN